jgi:YegS/Rv2252/BmrU family lipid kinase
VDAIVNVKAGAHTAEDATQSLRDAFSASGTEANVFHAKTGAEVVELAKRSVAGDAAAIVAAGGDGTINSVASAVIDSGKALGVVPFGTMNHFAKDLHIPLDIEGAVQTIVDGHTVKVDVGEVNGHIFVNNSSLGLYPSIVSERQRQQRLGSGKWPAYVWAAFAVLRRYPFLDIKLKVEEKELTSRTPFVFVGNNEYQMETLNIGGRATLDSGELSLYMTSDLSRLGLVRLALRALFGGLRQEKDFLALRTNEIVIATKQKRVRVALDGEVTMMQPPLHFRIRPKRLSVLVQATGKTT